MMLASPASLVQHLPISGYLWQFAILSCYFQAPFPVSVGRQVVKVMALRATLKELCVFGITAVTSQLCRGHRSSLLSLVVDFTLSLQMWMYQGMWLLKDLVFFPSSLKGPKNVPVYNFRLCLMIMKGF